MPGTLTFKLADLKEIAEHAVAAKEFAITSDVLFDRTFHKGGKVKKKDGWPDASNIDRSKLRPSFELIKNHGVCLISNGLPSLHESNGLEYRKAVYANGINPQVDSFEAWWDKATSIFGGDDTTITLHQAPEMVLEGLKRGLTKLQIRVNESSLSFKCV